MARDVEVHCRECIKCQQSKLDAPTRAPLTSMPIGRPWEMIAVDILEVLLSYNNSRYLLVVQDYFTKWATAIPLPDQTAVRITAELVKLFSMFGVPEILHSDQGRNFESTILRQTLEAFGVSKSRTTAYHPQCDGMVERMNRSLLQLLRAYVETQEDWERFLPLVLYAYRTAVHSSTGVSPFELMFGRQPQHTNIATPVAFDSGSYQAHLQAKLSEFRDLVESNMTQAANRQKVTYDHHSTSRTFKEGDTVWLSIPTAGKLDPRWEGRWIIKSIKSPINFEITDGINRTKVVHINRLQRRVQPHITSDENTNARPQSPHSWTSPQADHLNIPASVPRYPTRMRQQPNYLRY